MYGLDISLGQLHHCQDFCRKRGLEAELFLGTAEALPFKDGAFEATFHIGGINFFDDKQAAIDEMIRVAAQGCTEKQLRKLIGSPKRKRKTKTYGVVAVCCGGLMHMLPETFDDMEDAEAYAKAAASSVGTALHVVEVTLLDAVTGTSVVDVDVTVTL